MEVDDRQTAMMLTQAEWDDLEHIAHEYRILTQWAEDDPTARDRVHRRRDLAQRLIEANR